MALRPQLAGALVGVSIVVGACSAGAAPTSVIASAGSSAPPAAAATASGAAASAGRVAAAPTPTLAPSQGPVVIDTTSYGDAFALPMRVTAPAGWKVLDGRNNGADAPVGCLTIIHLGDPPEDQSQWWGTGGCLVDGARVADPKVARQAATLADRWLPWPADYLKYLASLPGVEVVQAEHPVTIGGVAGKEEVVRTPALHPTIYLKGDTTWLGGGPVGLDPAMERLVIMLPVHGRTLELEYDDDPATFGARLAQVRSILDSISFP